MSKLQFAQTDRRNTPDWIEVLSPAGSFESLEAAVKAGADAVYAGGSQFGARAYAGNFDEEEMKRAIDYVHLHNKKLYMTVNTLFKQEELDQLAEYGAKTGRSMNVYEQEEWTEYQESVSMDRNGEPAEIAVLRESWRKAAPEEAENWIGTVMNINNEQSYICEDSEEVWSWENPSATKGREELGFGHLSFPAQSQGRSCWKEWKQDEYLQGFPDQENRCKGADQLHLARNMQFQDKSLLSLWISSYGPPKLQIFN